MLALCCALNIAADTAARGWLDRAAAAIGVPAAHGAVLRIVESSARFLSDQSDRTYEPYIMQPATDTVWVDPTTGVERAIYGRNTYIRSTRATFRVADSGTVADARLHGQFWSHRAFDPWVVVAEWRRATGVRVAGRRRYRDYRRVVLTRPGRFGVDSLLLDERTAIPVALARTEAHYFLGPFHATYQYATWFDAGRGALYPVSVTRLVDGRVDESRYIDLANGGALIPADSAPPVVVPDSTLTLALDPQHRFPADPPDTVAVGQGTYLLVSRAFTSVVSLQRDTVFILDTPSGEDRARHEREWVGRLFPGRHPIVLVAMNPVWPHIAGLRFWVAHGATVVAARPIVPYLRAVLARRWTAMPDALERARARTHPRIDAVDDSASFAGARVRLYPMEEIDGETVLLAFIAPSRFVWASDHIQDISTRNIYVDEVRRTAARHELAPTSTSGPHFRVIPWATVDSLGKR